MALLPESGVNFKHAHRTNWGTVSRTFGVWRRRPDPQLSTSYGQDVGHAHHTSYPGFRGMSRVGGLRLTAFAGFPLAFVMSGVTNAPTLGSGIDLSVGNPGPSLRLAGNNTYSITLRIPAGSRKVRCEVLQPDATKARATLRVQGNPAIGLGSPLVETAVAGTSWQVLETDVFVATANGGVRVELCNPDQRGDAYVYFDNIKVL